VGPRAHKVTLQNENFSNTGKVNVKLSLCLTKYYGMNMYPVLR